MNRLELTILFVSLAGAVILTFPDVYSVLIVWGAWGLYVCKPKIMTQTAHVAFVVACCAIVYFGGPYIAIPVLLRIATIFYGEFKVGVRAVARDIKSVTLKN